MERMKQTFDKEMTAVKKLLADQKFSSVGCKQPGESVTPVIVGGKT